MAANNSNCEKSPDAQAEAAADEQPHSLGFGMRLAVSGIQKKFPHVKNISTITLASLLKNQTPVDETVASTKGDHDRVLILDSRPVEESQIGSIPGSIRVDWEENVDTLLTKVPQIQAADDRTTVICYCAVGYRSSAVADRLGKYFHKQGKDSVKVYNLEGSIFQWANEGRPMVDGNGQPTKYTHPYNAIFGKLLNRDLRRTRLDNDSSL